MTTIESTNGEGPSERIDASEENVVNESRLFVSNPVAEQSSIRVVPSPVISDPITLQTNSFSMENNPSTIAVFAPSEKEGDGDRKSE